MAKWAPRLSCQPTSPIKRRTMQDAPIASHRNERSGQREVAQVNGVFSGRMADWLMTEKRRVCNHTLRSV
jgi:hypothetical protein